MHDSSSGLFDLLTFRGRRGSGALETLVNPPAVPAHLNPAHPTYDLCGSPGAAAASTGRRLLPRGFPQMLWSGMKMIHVWQSNGSWGKRVPVFLYLTCVSHTGFKRSSRFHRINASHSNPAVAQVMCCRHGGGGGGTARAFHLLGGCPPLTGQLGSRGAMFRFTQFYFDRKRNEPSDPDVGCFYLHRCATAPLEKAKSLHAAPYLLLAAIEYC